MSATNNDMVERWSKEVRNKIEELTNEYIERWGQIFTDEDELDEEQQAYKNQIECLECYAFGFTIKN